MVLDDVEPSEFATWLGNAVYRQALRHGPPLAIAGAKKARDYFRPSFREFAYSKNATKYARLTNATRAMNRTNTTKFAGGQRAPSRVNAKNGSWVKRGKYRGKDAKTIATRGWVKQTLALDNVRKEVTANATTVTSGAPPVFFRMGKNIDKGTDQGDRLTSQIFMLGFRVFGSYKNVGPQPSSRLRCLILQDKTPMRTLTEAFFSTNGDSREPVDFPLSPTSMDPVNALRPINTDRWIVKADWVEHLTPDKASTNPNLPTCLLFNRYFKINKKLTFNPGYNTETTDLLPTIYFVYFQVEDNGGVTTVNDLNLQFEEYFS